MSDSKKPNKFLSYCFWCGIFFLLFLVIIIFFQIIDIFYFNGLYEKQYNTEIKPKGDAEINKILSNVSNISDNRLKFNKMAEWELSGFESYHWGNYSECMYSNEISHELQKRTYFFPNCPFSTTKSGKIRVLNTLWPVPNISPYDTNPYWIAFYKTGACGELATLFNFIANKSGNETRVVRSQSHAWVEIKIDNEWWYFDPLCYKVKYNQDESFETKWFNHTYFFKQNCYDEVPPIWVANTGELVGYHYPENIIW